MASTWFLNEFDMRANSRLGALRWTWQTTWLMRCWSASSVCRCTQKCVERTQPLLERIFIFFLICGRAAAVSKDYRFWCSRGLWAFEPSSQHWRSGFPHVIRHSARKRAKANPRSCFFVFLKQRQHRWPSSETLTPLAPVGSSAQLCVAWKFLTELTEWKMFIVCVGN